MSKLLRVRDKTYEELGKLGKWNETMDSIIVKLLLHEAGNHIRDEYLKGGASVK
jgi:hypothetical protein